MPNKDENVAPGSTVPESVEPESGGKEIPVDLLKALAENFGGTPGKESSKLEKELIDKDGKAKEVNVNVDKVIVLGDVHLEDKEEVEKLVDVLKEMVNKNKEDGNKEKEEVLFVFNGDISDDVEIFNYLKEKLDELYNENGYQYIMFTAEHESLRAQDVSAPVEKYALRVKIEDGKEVEDEGSKLELLTHFKINVGDKVVRVLPGVDVELKENIKKRGIDDFINYVKEQFDDWEANVIITHPGGDEYKLVKKKVKGNGEKEIEEKGLVLNKISEVLSKELKLAGNNPSFANLVYKINAIAFQALYVIQEVEGSKEEKGEKVGEAVKEVLKLSPYTRRLAKYLESNGINPYAFMVDTVNETMEEIKKEGLKVVKVKGESEKLIEENFGNVERIYGHIHELSNSSVIAGKYVSIGNEIKQVEFPVDKVYF